MSRSLEIVNDKIAELKDTYQHYTAVEKDKAKSSFAKFDIEQFQQIKADLEVLEIIKNKTVNIEALKFCLENYDNVEKAMEIYNYFEEDYRKLTLEELLKLKQWLESYEVGDSNA